MNAKDARKLSSKTAKHTEDKQLSDIMEYIKKAANCGETDCNYFGHIHKNVVKQLQEEGYFLTLYGSAFDLEWTNISW